MRSSVLKLVLACLIMAGMSEARAGVVLRVFYENIPGTAVSALTDDPSFPYGVNDAGTGNSGFPLYTEIIQGPFDVLDPEDAAVEVYQNYGTFTRGYLEVPESGAYTFFTASDDASEFRLSTDHDPANVTHIAMETGCCTPTFSGARVDARSVGPIELEKNKRYYFEYLQKEGAGGSFVRLGWEMPDGTRQVVPGHHLITFPVSPTNYTPAPNTAPEFLTSYGADGGGNPWPVAQTHPPDVSVDERGQAVFFVTAQASEPATYQWFKNGVAIDGEMGASLVFAASAEDNNAEYHVTIDNAHGALITSETGVLTVVPDTVVPTVTVVDTRGNPGAVSVTFSEPVDETTATNPANYSIDGGTVTISSVELSTDDRVRLNVSTEWELGSSHTIEVSGVQDRAFSPNTVATSSHDFAYAGGQGTTYNFNAGVPANLTLYGTSAVRDSGSHDGSGYLSVTDGVNSQLGAALFTDRLTITRVKFTFKLRVGDGSNPPADGFSFNVATDIPEGTYGQSEEGYRGGHDPATFPQGLIVAFDNWASGAQNGAADNSPSFEVKYGGQSIANVPAPLQGNTAVVVDGIPSIYTGDRWVDVVIDLKPDGSLYMTYDGYTIFNGVQTGFTGMENAQVGFGGRTGGANESHWVDDLVVNFQGSEVGPVGVATHPVDATANENTTASFSVVGSGADPYSYQWYKNGEIIPGATSGFYTTPEVTPDDNGAEYHVVVSNEFSTSTSDPATLTVINDTTAPTATGISVATDNMSVTVNFSERMDATTAENTANYSLDPSVNINSATLSANLMSVTLVTDELTAGQAYTLTINNVTDIAAVANPVAANTTLNVSAYTLAQGFLSFEVWRNIGGTPVANLTGNARYPDSPDDIYVATAFHSRTVPAFAGDGTDNYGARMTGILVPPLTGQYRLFLRSDDASQVWLSTDADPANATMIMEQTGCCNAMMVNDGSLSALVDLVAGQEYYMYGLVKEGGGGDYLTVGWRMPGQDLDSPVGNNAGIPGAYFKGLVNPTGASVSITQHPQSQTVTANSDVTLSVAGTGTSVYGGLLAYQWMRDGEVIAGANGTSYSFRTSIDDDQAVYTAQLLAPGASAISDGATLTVNPDDIAPSIVRVEGSDTFTRFTVFFDEPVQAPAVGDVTVTSEDGAETLTVSDVTLSADELSAVITTSAQTEGTRYEIRINPLIDLSQNEADVTGVITSWVRRTGGLTRKFYQHTGGNWMTAVYDPNQFNLPPPTSQNTITSFQSPRDVADNYGVVMQGWITAPETGQYIFYLSSDDQSRLYLSLDESRANLGVPIASEPQWNGYRNWLGTDRRNATNPENRSIPIQMTAGDTYYIEAVFNEGGGGDGMEVTWQLPSQTEPPANGSASIAGQHLSTFFPVPEQLAISGITPANNVREVSLTPTISATISAGGRALDADSVELRINGEVVAHTLDFTPQEAPFNGTSVISYTVPSADAFDSLETVNVELTYQDDQADDYSNSWSFTTIPVWPVGTIFIEAEDYNHTGGQWVVDGNGGPTGAAYTGGAYLGLTPVDDVDANTDSGGGGDLPYRYSVGADSPGHATVSFNDAEDTIRSDFSVTSNWKIGWTGSGEWSNYTRDFGTPAREFDVYARISRGDGNAPSAILAKVTNATAVNAEQVKEDLGMFSGPPSRNWSNMWTYQLHVNGDPNTPKRVTLDGVQTLRFTWGGTSGDYDYLALVPAGAGPISLSFTSIVDNGDGTITLGWTGDGTLVESATVDGTYTAVAGASGTSHTITVGGAGSMMFYQLQATQ